MKGRQTFPVAWNGEEALAAAVSQARQSMLARLRRLLDRLVSAQLISPHDARAFATPPIELSIVDLRSGRNVRQR